MVGARQLSAPGRQRESPRTSKRRAGTEVPEYQKYWWEGDKPIATQWPYGLKTIHSTIDAPPGVPGVSKNHILFFTYETIFLLR